MDMADFFGELGSLESEIENFMERREYISREEIGEIFKTMLILIEETYNNSLEQEDYMEGYNSRTAELRERVESLEYKNEPSVKRRI